MEFRFIIFSLAFLIIPLTFNNSLTNYSTLNVMFAGDGLFRNGSKYTCILIKSLIHQNACTKTYTITDCNVRYSPSHRVVDPILQSPRLIRPRAVVTFWWLVRASGKFPSKCLWFELLFVQENLKEIKLT